MEEHTPCNQDTYCCKGIHKCCQENLLSMLDFTHNLLTENGISYWLNYGSLLGAVRDKKIIPWDSDIDLGIWDTDIPKVLDICKEFLLAGYCLVLDEYPKGIHRRGPLTIFCSHINRLHVTLGIFTKRGNFGHNVNWAACCYALPDLENLKLIEFNGNMYYAPSNPEKGLTRFYGSDWKTPRVKSWVKKMNSLGLNNLEIQNTANIYEEYEWEIGRQLGGVDDLSEDFVIREF